MAPLIWVQPAGVVVKTVVMGEVHRSQARARFGVGLPRHVPMLRVQVEPTVATPETAGATVVVGAEAGEVRTLVGAPTFAVPDAFVAVVKAVTYLPASAGVVV